MNSGSLGNRLAGSLACSDLHNDVTASLTVIGKQRLDTVPRQ